VERRRHEPPGAIDVLAGDRCVDEPRCDRECRRAFSHLSGTFFGGAAILTGPPVGLVFSGGAVLGQMNPIASALPTTPAVTVITDQASPPAVRARTRFTLD